MSTTWAPSEGALRVRLSEDDSASGVAARHPGAGVGVLGAGRAAPREGDAGSAGTPHEQTVASAAAALGGVLAVHVLSAQAGRGLLGVLGVADRVAGGVVRPVAQGDRPGGLRVGDGVEVSGFATEHLVGEMLRLLPAGPLEEGPVPLVGAEREVVLATELATAAVTSLRAGDLVAARTACRLGGLDEVPPLLESLTSLAGEASVGVLTPGRSRVQRLVLGAYGWVELRPTEQGLAHRLVDREALERQWTESLAGALDTVLAAGR